ncbi:MAG: hypothetical protein ACI9BW_003788 [Gammaproteobacteria bacterium]|jgi:hypothetical protein
MNLPCLLNVQADHGSMMRCPSQTVHFCVTVIDWIFAHLVALSSDKRRAGNCRLQEGLTHSRDFREMIPEIFINR